MAYVPQLIISHDGVGSGFVNIQKAKGVIMRNTLNSLAFLTRKNEIKNIQDDFILRNKFTTSSIKVEKAVGKNISTMQSSVGVLDRADYMELQEFGGIKKPKRGGRLAMAQVQARGGSKSKVISREAYLSKIKKQTLKWTIRKGTKRSRTVAMAYMAKKTNMFFKYSKNIYKISSFIKSKNRIKFMKIHLYNISETTARIKARPHLRPALVQPVRDAQNIFESQTRKLLREKYII